MSARKTTEQVIEEFREVHGDRYDYSKVEYKHVMTKVTIICPVHGDFNQTPNSHKPLVFFPAPLDCLVYSSGLF